MMGEHADTSFNTTGSRWLQPASEHLGLPLDQVGAPTAGLEGARDTLRLAVALDAVVTAKQSTCMDIRFGVRF